jgi:hypothetical protein
MMLLCFGFSAKRRIRRARITPEFGVRIFAKHLQPRKGKIGDGRDSCSAANIRKLELIRKTWMREVAP